MNPNAINLYLERKQLYDVRNKLIKKYIEKFDPDGKLDAKGLAGTFDMNAVPKEMWNSEAGSSMQNIVDVNTALKEFGENLDDDDRSSLRQFITSKNLYKRIVKKFGSYENGLENAGLTKEQKEGVQNLDSLVNAYSAKRSEGKYQGNKAQASRASLGPISRDPKKAVNVYQKWDPDSEFIYNEKDDKIYGRPKGSKGAMMPVNPGMDYYTNPNVSMGSKTKELLTDSPEALSAILEGITENVASGTAASGAALLPGPLKLLAPAAAIAAGAGSSYAIDKKREDIAKLIGLNEPMDTQQSLIEGGIGGILPLGKMGLVEKIGGKKSLEKALLNKFSKVAPTRNAARMMAEKARQPHWGATEKILGKISSMMTDAPYESYMRYAAERDDLLKHANAGTLGKVGAERLHELQLRMSDIAKSMSDMGYGNLLDDIKKLEQGDASYRDVFDANIGEGQISGKAPDIAPDPDVGLQTTSAPETGVQTRTGNNLPARPELPKSDTELIKSETGLAKVGETKPDRITKPGEAINEPETILEDIPGTQFVDGRTPHVDDFVTTKTGEEIVSGTPPFTIDLRDAKRILDREISDYSKKASQHAGGKEFAEQSAFFDRKKSISEIREKYFPGNRDWSKVKPTEAYDIMRLLSEDLINYDAAAYTTDTMIGHSVRNAIRSKFPSGEHGLAGSIQKRLAEYSNIANINTAIKRKNLSRSHSIDPDLERIYEGPEHVLTGERNPEIFKNTSKQRQDAQYVRKGERAEEENLGFFGNLYQKMFGGDEGAEAIAKSKAAKKELKELKMPFQKDDSIDKAWKQVGKDDTDELLDNILGMQNYLGMDNGPTIEAKKLYNQIKTQKEWMTPIDKGGGFPGDKGAWMATIPGGFGGAMWLASAAGAPSSTAAAVAATGLAGVKAATMPRTHRFMIDLIKAGQKTGSLKGQPMWTKPLVPPLAAAKFGSKVGISRGAYDMFDRQPSYEGN